MRKIVLGLSGGMDSATLLGLLLNEGAEVHSCSFIYGSKHNRYERDSALKVFNYYKNLGFNVHWHDFDLTEAFKDFSSALLLSGEEIPEGHYEASNMKSTVVPGRNLIFASIMAGLAESIGAQQIALGVHSGDHQIYPDCRPEFIIALEEVILKSSDGKVQVITPFLHDDKASILKRGYEDFKIKVPYQLTRTCYKHQELSCGKCGACQERLEAFHNIGIEDPILYEK